MPKVILFRCPRFALDDVAIVVEVTELDRLLRELEIEDPVAVLIGSEVPESVAQQAIDLIVQLDKYFLRLRRDDDIAWVRRLVRFAVAPR